MIAASRFEAAKCALAAGDFASAIRHAREAEDLISSKIQSTDYGNAVRPVFSVVVVLYTKHDALAEFLGVVAQYSNRPEFEFIFVNNGAFSPRDVSRFLKRFRWVDVGFNFGCSGGRNLGARLARGKFLIFLDDDGVIKGNALESLASTIIKYDALAVRGRIYPRTRSFGVRHYDLGDDIIYAVPTTEGISIWRRQEFLKVGGFDPLLAGGEGKALWLKLINFFGYRSFLYTPEAVLLHDYAKSDEHFHRKKAKSTPNNDYFNFVCPGFGKKKAHAAFEGTRRALEYDPENAGLHFSLGKLLQELERLDEAELAYRQAIALKPRHAEAHRQLSLVLARQNRHDEALAAARQAIESDPENAGLLFSLGKLLQKLERLDEAELAYRQAIALKPRHAEAHCQLSLILVRQNRHDEALAAARQAIESGPENAGLHFSLGNLLQELERLDEAELAYRHAIALKPQHAEAHRQLSLVLARQKRR